MPDDRRKYLFDLNNFDRPDRKPKEEDLPPPPPTFSLEEMGAAEQEGFMRGREDGLEEARTSREQYIAAQVSGLNEQIRALFLSEQIREKHFEDEAVSLAKAMFSKVFPSFAARHSIDEISELIRNVISHQDKAAIKIEVPFTDLDEITERIALLLESSEGRLTIKGADDLDAGSCRLSWENGGALRNQTALLDMLTREIEDMLAPKAQTRQNIESNDESEETTKGEDQ